MEKFDLLGKKLDGSVLIIGYDEESSFSRIFKNNKNITDVYLLNNTSETLFGKNSKRKKASNNINPKRKRISITKLAKELKKINIDYLVCKFDTIKPFFRSFIKNSILVGKKKVYLFLDNDDMDPKEIELRYKRFGLNVNVTNHKNEYLYEIEINNYKYPFIKGLLYNIRDLGYDLVEYIANILIG